MFNPNLSIKKEKTITLELFLEKYNKQQKRSLSITDRFILVYMIARKLKEDHSNNIYRKYIIPKNVILNFQKNPIQIEINSNLNDDDDDDDDINSFSALEVLKDDSNNDFRKSDIYSFGLLTHYIFTGKKPFINDFQKQSKEQNNKYMGNTPLLNLPENIDSFFNFMISLTMNKDPEKRLEIEKIVELIDLGFVLKSMLNEQKEINYFKNATDNQNIKKITNIEDARKFERYYINKEKNDRLATVVTLYLADYLNCPIAQKEIGKYYYNGTILPKDTQKSYEYLKLIENGDDAEGLFYLAQALYNSKDSKCNTIKCQELFQKSANLGHIESQICLKRYFLTKYEYDQSPKVIILGKVGVGKTAFVKKIKNMYDCSDTVPTLSSEIHNIPYNDKDDKKKCFTIEDTHGMERYNALPNIFYREANLAIIMFSIDCRNSFNYVDYAIDQMKTLAGNIPIIILGNKMDSDRSVSYNEGVAKARQHHAEYVEVSCIMGWNIDLALDRIVETAYKNKNDLNEIQKTSNVNLQNTNNNNIGKGGCCLIS